jgi:hypothetical protein
VILGKLKFPIAFLPSQNQTTLQGELPADNHDELHSPLK